MAQRVKTDPAATGLSQFIQTYISPSRCSQIYALCRCERGVADCLNWSKLRLSYQYLSICLLSDRHRVRMTPGRWQGVISQSLLADCYVCLYWNVVSAPDVCYDKFLFETCLIIWSGYKDLRCNTLLDEIDVKGLYRIQRIFLLFTYQLFVDYLKTGAQFLKRNFLFEINGRNILFTHWITISNLSITNYLVLIFSNNRCFGIFIDIAWSRLSKIATKGSI